MIINETIILIGILSFSWTEYFWEQYLLLRQRKIYKTNTTIPNDLKDMLNVESFKKARIYALDKLHFRLFKDLFGIVLTTFILCIGLFGTLWQKSEEIAVMLNFSEKQEIVISCIYITLFTFINFVMNIPFSIYGTFVLEEKHGFNKQTIGFFIKDQIKSIVVNLAIMLPIIVTIIYIIMVSGKMLVPWLWLFTFCSTLILMTIYPSVIAPLFDKFTPLSDGSLKESIENLASKLKFPLSKVYIVEGSKRSAHSNAYFSGMFGLKRIVLFDTLIERYDEEKRTNVGCTELEILGILAHELGHWKCNHLVKTIIVTELNLLLLFAAFEYLFKFSPLYTTVGLPPGNEPIIIGLLVVFQLILSPYNAVLSYFQTILSRKFEYEADDFAVSLNYNEELLSALIKLGKDNLDYPIYDKWYSAWYHSHPTLLHRIENIKLKARKMKTQ